MIDQERPYRQLPNRRVVSLPAAPPVPVDFPMSRTMEIEYDAEGNITATPPTDYDG